MLITSFLENMNAKILTGLCILLLASGMSSASVEIKTHISKIVHEVNPSTYVNRGEEVTITAVVMGKKVDDIDWEPADVTVKIESDPGNPGIPSQRPSGESFSFTPQRDTWITLTFEGDGTYQASQKKILIGVLYFSSPLVSSQFIMLSIILILTLLSYRLFSRRKLDAKSLWGEIRGE